MPTDRFRESLRWILSESGQLVRVESSATNFIRSLENGEWCVGTMADDDSITEERTYANVDDAIDDYITRVTERNDW